MSEKRLAYRPEIDGLRAIAVLSVLAFHAGLAPGGFIGVDIFFVISGFLIMALALIDLERGEFSITQFYARRVRRLLPALIFVMVAVVLAGLAFFVPHELISLGHVIAATGLLASNAAMVLQGGYFAAASELNPLLHLWSLAVEAQYYLAFPFLTALFWRLGGKMAVAIAIASFSVVSFLLANWLPGRHDFLNFYLLPSRVWEFGAGAGLALAMATGFMSKASSLWAEAVTSCGLGLILLSVIFFDEATPSPSRATLVPVLGSILIIFGTATHRTFVGRLIQQKSLLLVGLASYSIYLWHQPLFAFARVISGTTDLPWSWVALLGVLSIGIGLLSWRWVETFFQRGNLHPRGDLRRAFACLAAMVAVGSLLVVSRGFLYFYKPEDRSLVAQSNLERGRYVSGAMGKGALRNATAAYDKRVLLIGDSFAQDVYNMVRESDQLNGYDVRTYSVAAGCQIAFNPRQALALAGLSPEHVCPANYRSLEANVRTALEDVPIVFLAASWADWSIALLPQTLASLGLRPDQEVYIFGPKYFGPNIARDYLGWTLSDRVAERFALPAKLQAQEAQLSAIAQSIPEQETGPLVEYISLTNLYCSSPEACRTFTPDAGLISYDTTHLTPEGAEYLGRALFARLSLSNVNVQEKQDTPYAE